MSEGRDPPIETLRLALHAAPSGIVVVDESGLILFVNQTLADMFGYRMDDLHGKPVEVLLPPQRAAAHRRQVEAYARDPALRPMGTGRDLEGIARDGRRFPVEIGLRPAQTATGRCVVATVIDISKRKAIEERLRRHEEQLEELVAERTAELRQAQQEKERMTERLIQAEKMTAIGTLVSGIGHEINNPLYVIHAAAEALAEESDPAECQALGWEILKQAKHIAETVRSLSHYARPGARHELKRVDVNVPIASAVELARRSLRNNGVEIRAEARPVSEILAKPEEIQQVIFNLVRNGVQAIDDEGSVEVRVSEHAGWITIKVRDSGTGIPTEHLKRLFDPFFTTKGPDEGEGLGLYVVRQIVTRYGGDIAATNVTGGGAEFVVRFPAAGGATSQ